MAEVLKFVDPRCLNLSLEGSDPPKLEVGTLSKIESPQYSPMKARKISSPTLNSSWSGSESLYLSPGETKLYPLPSPHYNLSLISPNADWLEH